jgi:type IV pilus assembly protein PilP
MLSNYSKLLSFLLIILVTTGCTNNNQDMVALQAYTSDVINRPGGAIEPVPVFLSYEAFAYSAAGLRGPFDPPVTVVVTLRENGEEIRPDESREREELESFSIASLTMVGSISGREGLWVLIQDEAAKIHRVIVGNYLGRNHGQILSASATQIDILEIVPSGGGGWIERPQTITLEQTE